jgi:hypothetical protein
MPAMGTATMIPDPRPGFARCRLIVDRAAGTATWVGDGRTEDRRQLRIGDAPGELSAVVRVIYPRSLWWPALAGRLLLVDSSGTVLARSMVLQQDLFFQMWPYSVLDRSGLPATEERFHNTRLLQKAHRGAAPSWPFTAGYGWLLLTCAVLVAVLFGAAALLIALTGWSA